MTLTTVVMTFLVFNPLLASPVWTSERDKDNYKILHMSVSVDVLQPTMQYETKTFTAEGDKINWDLAKTVSQKYLKFTGDVSADENNNCFLKLTSKNAEGIEEKSLKTLNVDQDIESMNGYDDSHLVVVHATFLDDENNLALTMWTVNAAALQGLQGMDCATLSILNTTQHFGFRRMLLI